MRNLIKAIKTKLNIADDVYMDAEIQSYVEGIDKSLYLEFFKALSGEHDFRNPMDRIAITAKKFKPAEVNILAGTHDKAKAMYDKFYAQQSAMTDYTQANRETIPNDRDWFKSIDYSKLKNRDGSLTYTKQEVYVLNELGCGEFLLDLPTKANSAEAIKLIKKTIDKAITTKYSDAKGIESKRVLKMVEGRAA